MLEVLNIAAKKFVGHRTLTYLLIPHLTTLHPAYLGSPLVPRAGCKTALTASPAGLSKRPNASDNLHFPHPSISTCWVVSINVSTDSREGSSPRHLKPHLAKHDEYIQVFLPHENFRSGRQTGHHCHILGHPLVPSTRGRLPGRRSSLF